MMDADQVFTLLQQNAADIFSSDGLQKRLAGGRPLKVKFGADPTRPDLHLGHTVPLRMLKLLQDAGYEIIFEKCMKVPDSILADYFRLTTAIPEPAYAALMETDIRRAHGMYAREIVRLYHGENATEAAERRYASIASGGAPAEMEAFVVAEKSVALLDLLKNVGFASSHSDARRLISGRGIRLDGQVVEDVNLSVESDAVLRRGKNKFIRIRFNAQP